MYRQTSDITPQIVGNQIVDNSDVVGASHVGAATTTSSSSVVMISSIWILTYVSIMSMKRSGIVQSLERQSGHGDHSAVVGFISDCHYWN